MPVHTIKTYYFDELPDNVQRKAYKTLYDTFDDLITDCLNRFFQTWSNCLEYSETFEFYEDEANANEWEYLADGTKWRYTE